MSDIQRAGVIAAGLFAGRAGNEQISDIQRAGVIAAGLFGRKTGRGFCDYTHQSAMGVQR